VLDDIGRLLGRTSLKPIREKTKKAEQNKLTPPMISSLEKKKNSQRKKEFMILYIDIRVYDDSFDILDTPFFIPSIPL
jgi:hypothetical protein